MSLNAAAKRIVIIDDDLDMLQLMKTMLGQAYEVSGTPDPTQAVDLVQHIRPDLILLDLMMPDIDGWTLYKAIRENELTQHIPVIIVTAKTNALDKVLGLQIAHVDGYLNKPFSHAELLGSVNKALEGKGDRHDDPDSE